MTMPQRNVHGGDIIVSCERMAETAARIATLRAGSDGPMKHVTITTEEFANGESKPLIRETVRGYYAYLLYDMQHPHPEIAFLRMLHTTEALSMAGVEGITLVLPYMTFLRQDKMENERSIITGRFHADLIQSNTDVKRIITMDMHVEQAQGFFSIPVDHLRGEVLHAEFFRDILAHDMEHVTVLSPDVGGGKRTRRFALRLGEDVPIALIDKRRPQANESEIVTFMGEVKDRIVLIYDDIIDTGGSILNAYRAVMERKATRAYICATHGIFSRGAEQKFKDAGCQVVILPTIPRTREYWLAHQSWLTPFPIEVMLSNAIHEASIVGGSVSKLSK